MANNLIDQSYLDFNRYYQKFSLINFLIRLIKSSVLTSAFYLVVLQVFPLFPPITVIVAIFFWLGSFVLHQKNALPKMEKSKIPLFLDMKYQNDFPSPYSLAKIDIKNSGNWNKRIAYELKQYSLKCREITQIQSLTTIVPTLILCLMVVSTPIDLILDPIIKSHRLFFPITAKYDLSIEKGLTVPDGKSKFNLISNQTSEIEVSNSNLFKIQYINLPTSDIPYTLEVKSKSPFSDTFENELLLGLEKKEELSSEEFSSYEVSFALDKTNYLFIPELSKTTPVAKIIVKSLPIPIVNLKPKQPNLKNPWPDEEYLPLIIRIKSEEPIDEVNLIVESNKKTYKELVTKVLAADKKYLEINYSVLLETYVSKDIDQIILRAEAIDRSMPFSQKGISNPIAISTASAYGRYVNTLKNLKEIRNQLIKTQEKDLPSLDPKIKNQYEVVMQMSLASPFFDSLDRMFLDSLRERLDHVVQNLHPLDLSQLAEDISRFLFDHEILNDRERDRDFFIAARTLSRLIEDKLKDNDLHQSTKQTIDRISSFVNQRHEKWQLRVKALPNPPESWEQIKDKPFTQNLFSINELSENKEFRSAKNLLTETVTNYQAWIDELEKEENKARNNKEKERKNQINKAMSKLKKIQRNQSSISQTLDKSRTQPKETLKNNWRTKKELQSKNAKATKELESEMAKISPQAAKRIISAKKSMDGTQIAANEENFVEAESYSDFANRLLRQASAEASKSSRRKSRLERRRRVMGDNYFGSRVVGGDIEFKRTYQVNKKYREEVLDQIFKQKDLVESEEQKKLLEDYMFRIIK